MILKPGATSYVQSVFVFEPNRHSFPLRICCCRSSYALLLTQLLAASTTCCSIHSTIPPLVAQSALPLHVHQALEALRVAAPYLKKGLIVPPAVCPAFASYWYAPSFPSALSFSATHSVFSLVLRLFSAPGRPCQQRVCGQCGNVSDARPF